MKTLILILLFIAGPALAVNPEEMLADAKLEARAEALDQQIRCVKCQSEPVASSNAAWAAHARRMIRELVTAGKSDQDVLNWFRARYGDFVLMDPPKEGINWILWLAGPILLICGLLIAWNTVRARAAARPEDGLSAADAARVAELMEERT